jgi:hypothetical protein
MPILYIQGSLVYYPSGNTNDKITVDLGLSNTTLTGSEFAVEQHRVSSSAYAMDATSSMSNVGLLVAKNTGTGSIEIATDSSFTKRVCVLPVSRSCIVPWSSSAASASFYARGLDNQGSLLWYNVFSI